MRNNYLFIAILSTAFMACGNDKKEYDATGTFEATEVTVSTACLIKERYRQS